jgi:hypothetical protein
LRMLGLSWGVELVGTWSCWAGPAAALSDVKCRPPHSHQRRHWRLGRLCVLGLCWGIGVVGAWLRWDGPAAAATSLDVELPPQRPVAPQPQRCSCVLTVRGVEQTRAVSPVAGESARSGANALPAGVTVCVWPAEPRHHAGWCMVVLAGALRLLLLLLLARRVACC